MTLDYDRLMAFAPPAVEHTYTEKDVMLYALGIGMGYDPLDEQQLAFVYEKDLRVVPTVACVLAYMRIADMDLGMDYRKAVHGDQKTVFHKPFPRSGTIIGQNKISNVVDRGADKGALIYIDREVRDKATGDLLATTTMGVLARADGGFGGPNTTVPSLHAIPDRAPDYVCDLPTLPQQALIYRLNADMNPLHADPDMAQKVGFDRPILHGLATYGFACHAILREVCNYDTARLKSLLGRFSAPVYPGETIRFEIWIDGEIVSFRARVEARDAVVINNGKADIAG